jgi:menaquinone-9 beta-reductase
MSQLKVYDVAIIGGGLAGLTLAIQLKQNGFSVVLFEKETYPFHKVCGEYISMESWLFLESLGVPLSTMQLPIINQLRVSAPNGNILNYKLDLGGFGISRYQLDFTLYKLAKGVGVMVVEDCKVTDVIKQTIKTTQGDFCAKITVGTWGKRSKMDAVLLRNFLQPHNRKLNDWVGVKYHVQGDLPDDVIELHNFKNGYCGISKIEDNRYCLCYLIKGEELRKAGSIDVLEQQVLYQNKYLQKYFTKFAKLYNKPLSISQISFERKTQQEQNILLAGDSAGLIAPLCGNGMSMAMHASKLLAVQLTLFLNGKQTYAQAIKTYEQQWQLNFASRLKTGRFIQSLFGSTTITNLLITALKPFPFLVKLLVKQTHGKPF